MKRCMTIALPKKKFSGIMLVGEAPGENEEETGAPFIGRAGQLLDSLLSGVGIDRASCIITNVFHIRPPKNKVDFFFTSKEAESLPRLLKYAYGGKFLKKEYNIELIRLMGELETYKPKVVVALGRVALWALTGYEGITKLHGKTIMSFGHKVIPCYHPAYLLRANNTLRSKMALDALRTAKLNCN